MKFKTFEANSHTEAIEKIKTEFGDMALITDTEYYEDGHVCITAALEDDIYDNEIYQAITGNSNNEVINTIREALEYHNVPFALSQKLLRIVELTEIAASETIRENKKARMSLAAAIEDMFRFNPLPEENKPEYRNACTFMMVGPPGGGKTLTVAKLATRSVVKRKNIKISVISTDTCKRGSFEELSAITKILNIETLKAKNPDILASYVSRLKNDHDLIFIDTPAYNPFSPQDMTVLGEYIAASDSEPVLVIPAGIDVDEAGEIADSFVELGVKRLIATRLDTSRRIGAILNAAGNSRLNLSDIGISSNIARGIYHITPMSMARLILPDE